MLKNTLIIALVILVLYLYYQQQKKQTLTIAETASWKSELVGDIEQKLMTIKAFLKDQLNSDDVEEVKSKLGSKTLDEILEENSDWETEVDTLTRTKDSLEADLTAQAEAFQARLREKDREIKKIKEDLTGEQKRLQKASENLTSEKQQHKGSLERIKLLTEQITSLEGELKRSKSPPEELVKEHQEQLRAINLLFDEKAQDCEKIDFKGLYKLLGEVAEREKAKPVEQPPVFSRHRKKK